MAGLWQKDRKWLAIFILTIFIIRTYAFGNEIGLSRSYREIGRMHSDSNSIGSKVKIRQDKVFLSSVDNHSLLLLYTENKEQLTLVHPDETRYFSFDFQRHTPRLKYQAESYQIDFTMPVVEVGSNNELYSRIESDNRNMFILPSLVGLYQFSDWEFELGRWEETDVQPFNYYRYMLYVLRTTSANVRYQIIEDHSIKVDFRIIDRIYPENYDLQKDEIGVAYQGINILKMNSYLQWTELLLQYVQTRYSDLNANTVDLTNNFRFKLLGLNHFLTYRLSYTDVITTYREGLLPYSLIETDEVKEDLWHYLEYAGFWRIFGSHFFLSWKYRIEDSLVENVVLDQEAELKLVYAF